MEAIDNTPAPQIAVPGFFQTMAARSVTIMSVHYEPKDMKFFHSRDRSFKLAAGTKEKPSYVTIYDSQQFLPDTATLATLDSAERYPASLPHPVPVEGIVADCLKEWQFGGLNAGASFPAGIIAIAGEVATPQEIERAWAMETRRCEALVREADAFAVGAVKGEITESHKKALRHIGSENRPWYLSIESGTLKISPASGKKIPMGALADDGIDLIEFYEKHNLDPLEFGDTYVSDLLKKRKAAPQGVQPQFPKKN